MPNVRGKSQGFSASGREVYPYESGAGGKLALLFVRHFVRKADGFLFYFQYRGTNADGVAGMQLAPVRIWYCSRVTLSVGCPRKNGGATYERSWPRESATAC